MPFISPEYFDGVYRGLFKEVTKFVAKFNKLPTLEAFKIEIDENNSLGEENYRQAIELLPNVFTSEPENLDWLIERTEKWCQDRAVFNAVMESISIIDGIDSIIQILFYSRTFKYWIFQQILQFFGQFHKSILFMYQ
jgi:hypothetical protein